MVSPLCMLHHRVRRMVVHIDNLVLSASRRHLSYQLNLCELMRSTPSVLRFYAEGHSHSLYRCCNDVGQITPGNTNALGIILKTKIFVVLSQDQDTCAASLLTLLARTPNDIVMVMRPKALISREFELWVCLLLSARSRAWLPIVTAAFWGWNI